MRAPIAAVVLSCIAGAAIAQQAVQQPEPFQAEYAHRPDGRAYARNYPHDAIEHGIEGAAILCCLPREDGRLECGAALEWPEGQGFGAASVRVASEFQMSPDSLSSFRATPGNWIRHAMHWRLGNGRQEDNERAFEIIRGALPQFCGPPSASTEAPQ